MFTHTYLRCSMEPELYEYENDNADSYEQDDWYYQNDNPEGQDLDDDEEWGDDFEEDSRDELYHDYMNEYDNYAPEREI